MPESEEELEHEIISDYMSQPSTKLIYKQINEDFKL